MKVGIVTGAIWATKKCDSLKGQSFMRVRLDGKEVVASDLTGAGVGERVLVAFGSAARLEHPNAPVDAAIVAILDTMEANHGS